MMAGILASQPPGLIKFDESGKTISHSVKDPKQVLNINFLSSTTKRHSMWEHIISMQTTI